ncbi:GTPase-activating protein and VPS9 domain-containing protein 1 [Lepeophtheirus salmonis]|uniref:Man(5)GlcNAc(2)-PP-dolichol translocation protein RFT1 n=1 Tax=Lepeophtheirus salmonis TaxID=72036 RepID=A0A7R8CF50_LEPSM|nr:GTPase-activating protein and VPS9 domain-containing protein 1 [Lepeophtheirus salmonis]CAF2803179.1 GTPase-activating protein and VPS9 domain-containing protein 1 [Lepeophtheirus salmonis]
MRFFLDIDPSKALIRFPPSERKKKFGIEGTPEYQKRLKDHREFIIKKLENITRKFINGIQDNIRSFPPSLSRLLRAMYSLLIKSFELKESLDSQINEESIRKPLTESNTFAGMGMSAGTAAASNFGFNDGSKTFTHIRDINNENKCDNLLPSSMANELTALLLAPLPEIIPGGLNGVHEIRWKRSLLHQEADNVLVIPLFDPSTSYDLPGLLSEEQVLSRSRQNSRVRMTLPNSDGSGNEVLEKRTRFSLSQDEGSIATSSLEDGDDQEDEDNPIIDNLSDMVSANVSGRGTPNVSGRDTPSSQVEGVPDDDEVIRSGGRNEGEEDEARGAIGGMVGLRTGQASRGHRHIPPNKSGQADLEEKFGRFEIKPQIKSRGSGVGLAGEGGDETVSLISDTWSTDVLASDTETLGEILTTSSDRFPHNNQNFADMDPFSRNLILEEFATSSSAGAAAALPQRMSGIQPSMPSDSTSVNLLDVGDTASEAWSIDVLDGDRESLCLGELDIEYISSTVSAEDNQYMEGISQSGRNTDILLVDDNSPVANRAEARGNNLSRPSRDAAIEQWLAPLGPPTSSKLPLGMEKAPLEDPNQATLSSHLSAASIASSSGSSFLHPALERFPNVLILIKSLEDLRNFHSKIGKLPKISRSRSSVESLRSSSDKCFSSHSNSLDNPSHSVDGPPLGSLQRSHESSDDILNKYRNKKPVAVGNLIDITDSLAEEEVDPRLIIDHNNLENCYAFQDAKRKLRLTLSSVDLSMMPDICHASSVEPEVIWLLKVQLSEALNLQDRNFIAQLHETLRCLSLFKKDGVSRILNSLKEEYKRRAPYMAYLVRCRQGLLCTLSRQERLLSRNEHRSRTSEFKELTVPDEKTALMNSFLALMNKELEHDPIWSSVCSTEQLKLSNIAIERSITSHIYFHAMYPNGEADINRDEVLSEHIRKLGEIITPSHKCLRIPRQYHYEQPWPSAQAEIRRLAAFKTPADKVSCIKRASQTIMNLLSLGSSKGVPAADDFIPVLVFILIKANPPSLLSTVQYVENFYGERLCGEDEYWWQSNGHKMRIFVTVGTTQFDALISAVLFDPDLNSVFIEKNVTHLTLQVGNSKFSSDIKKTMSSLAQSIKATSLNILTSILFRIITFILNIFILRHTSKDVLGIVNVRFNLLDDTILFLSREAFRRSCFKNPRGASLETYERGKSQRIKRKKEKEAGKHLYLLLRGMTLIGLIFVTFGFSYSHFLLHLYGGINLSSGVGPFLLRTHCVLVLFLAINGVAECFVFAKMSQSEIDSFNFKMICISGIFLSSAIVFVKIFGASGFIFANIFNFALRITHHTFFISNKFSDGLNPIRGMFPPKDIIFVLFLSGIICSLSEVLIYPSSQLVHLLCGGIVFILTLYIIASKEDHLRSIFVNKWNKKFKKL